MLQWNLKVKQEGSCHVNMRLKKSCVVQCVACERCDRLYPWCSSGLRHRWVCYWFKVCDFAILHWTLEGSVIAATETTTAATSMDAATHTAKSPVCPLNFVLHLSRLRGLGEGWGYIVLLHVHVQHRKSTIWKRKKDQRGKSESPDHILGLLTGNRFVQYISQSYVLCLNIDMHICGIGGGGRLHIGCACCITSETTFFIRFSAYV